MKRNWDVVREILLAIEETSPKDGVLVAVYGRIRKKFDIKEVASQDIEYHLDLLIQGGFIRGEIDRGLENYYELTDGRMTWEGEDLLNDIRDDGVWKEAKSKAGKAWDTISLEVLKELAKAVTKGAQGLM